MGIDHVLGLPCEPKRVLGVDGLVRLMKARSRADMVLATLRAQGDERPPHEVTIGIIEQRPEGTQHRKVTVQSLVDAAADLEPQRPHCVGCPVDLQGEGFGCYGYVAYPLPEAVESWLLAMLPDDLESTAGRMLVRACSDFPWDGRRAREMRAQGDTFFEARRSKMRRWGDEFALGSDQVFHMLFHVGEIGSTHAMMCCLLLGLVPHDTPADALADVEGRRAALAAAVPPVPPDASCVAMAGFLHALLVAARRQLDLAIDG
jgi:hypothetical protein